MAIPLADAERPIDPHGGREDLEAGLLRVLHRGSFVDDPTRAIRAARYAARLGFEPEPETAVLLRAADLGTVSADRREAELLRLASEATASRGFALLAEWGLIELREGGAELGARVAELLATPLWSEMAPLGEAVLRAARGPVGGEAALAVARPERPSRALALASGRDPIEIVLARALGGEWLDDFVAKWLAVVLEIDGSDLIAAGIPEGPAVGRGMVAARDAKIDGEAPDRERQLAIAIAAAHEAQA